MTTILDEARAAVGLSASPASRAAFEALVGEGEPAGVASAMLKQSTCWLTTRGIWRRAGIAGRYVRPPYEYLPGTEGSIAGAMKAAREGGVWVDCAPGRMPSPGDMVYVGEGAHWHVYTVESVTNDRELVSIDGGQLDMHGRQLVARKFRTWSRVGPTTLDASRFERPGIGLEGVGQRRVIGWIQTDKLPRVGPASAPCTSTSSAPIEGVDMSAANATPPPAALRAAGIRFGYVRLTLGLGSPDTRAAAHVRGLRAAGCLVGGYGVPFPPRPFSGGQVDAVAQARELVALHKALGLEGRLMIDAEEVTSGGRVVTATGAQHRDTLERYAETIIAEAGHRPILYTGAWWWNRFPELASSSLLTSLDLWLADYSNAPALIHPNGIHKALVHQYAGSDPKGRLGIIPGVPGYIIDRNHLYGSLDDLRA